jgi:hypothetical protein
MRICGSPTFKRTAELIVHIPSEDLSVRKGTVKRDSGRALN